MNNYVTSIIFKRDNERKVIEALKGQSVGPNGWNVVQYLVEHSGGIAGDVAIGCGMAPTQISRVIKALKGLKLIAQIPQSDKRIVYIKATDKGVKLHDRLITKVYDSLAMDRSAKVMLSKSLKG